jgi:hypothetical protein
MINNFTPFFTKLGKFKPDPAFRVAVSMFAVAIVIVGLNQFVGKQIATTACTTSSQLSSMVAEKSAIQSQIYELNNKISLNNEKTVSTQTSLVNNRNEITKTTSAIYSDSTVASYKKTADNSYLLWLRNKTGPYRAKYVQHSNTYNSVVASNSANNAKLATLNAEKATLDAQVAATDKTYTELNESLSRLQGELNALSASIQSAQGNMCATTTTTVTNTTSGYVPNTATGFCSDASDCQAGNNCMVGRCATPGSDLCNNDGDCHQGDRCEAGNCVGIPNVDEDTSVCNDVGACNNGSVGACVFTNCNSDMTNSCTSEYDEMGWRVKFGFGGISITNEDETNGCSFTGNRACDPGWTAFDWAPDLNDRTAGYSYWGCRTTEYNCVTKKNERREVTGCSFYTGR